MRINRQELLSSANRRARRARRTTGRILVSALGFGVAYYFDTENGDRRRKRLHETLQHSLHTIDSVLASETGGPPPILIPALRVFRTEESSVPATPPVGEPIASAR